MIRFFWKFRYLNFATILLSLLLCVISFDNFKVYFDSERIIELVDVDKDIIEKSIDDSNLLLVSVNISDTFSYKMALDISSALETVQSHDKIHSVRSIFNERVLIDQSVFPISLKLLDLDNTVSFQNSLIKIKKYNSNFITDNFQNLLFIVKCKNLEDELEKINVLEFLDSQFSAIFNKDINITGQIKSEIYIKENVIKELIIFILISSLLCGFIIFYFTRSFKLVFISLISIFISIVFTFTISNFLFGGIELVMIIIPAIIFIITISDFMHLLNIRKVWRLKYRLFRFQLIEIGRPVFLTSLTTAIGFLSFTFGSFTPLMRFGVITTFSIFVSLFVIVTLFALTVDSGVLRANSTYVSLLASVRSMLSVLKSYSKWLFSFFIVFFCLGVVNFKVDNYLTDEINHRSSLYKEIQHFEQNFGGIKPISLSLKNYTNDVASYLDFLKINDINIDIAINNKDTILLKSRIKDIGASESTKLYSKLNKHALENNFDIEIGGIGYLFDKVSNDLTYEVLLGLFLAILLIGFIFVLLNNFNFRYFWISLIPNFIPLLSCLGIMSVFGFYLSLSNAFIFAIVFGLIVDDSIHIISAYSINRKANKSVQHALKYCQDNTFNAIIKTTIIIIVSLIPLLFSEFKSISQLAHITILSAIIALVFDLLFLPGLLKKYIK
tara:strand:- start:3420 stop:5423 length:2004 start_codon:yes stop_codon:yes gene_type:complete